MKLGVYSIKRIIFEGEAVSVNCRTTSGEITILDNHRPLISSLVPGVIKVTGTDGNRLEIGASSGFIEVQTRNLVKFLVEEKDIKGRNINGKDTRLSIK